MQLSDNPQGQLNSRQNHVIYRSKNILVCRIVHLQTDVTPTSSMARQDLCKFIVRNKKQGISKSNVVVLKFPTLNIQMVFHVDFDFIGKNTEVQSNVYMCVTATSAMYIDLIRKRRTWSSVLTGVNW